MNLPAIHYFTRFLRKYIRQECVLVLLMFVGSLGTLVSPYILKIIIDDVFPSKNFTLLIEVLIIYLIISIFRIIITYTSNWMFEWVSNHIMKDIRMDLFSHLLRLPMSFYDKSKGGDIMHRVNNEVNSIQTFLTGSVGRLINSLCMIVGLATMLCILNSKLFLIALTIFPFIYINTYYFQPKIHSNIRQHRKRDSDILSFLQERISNIRLVKNYMTYQFEEDNLSREIDHQININMRNVFLSGTTRNISTLFTALIPILILYLGGRDVMSDAMSVGALVAFLQYINRMFDPFRDLMGLYFDMVRASVSMERIYEVIHLPCEPQMPPRKQEVLSDSHDISFNNITFRYKDNIVLKNFDLHLQSGKKYALVGNSGCGKSTILNLLVRFYEPDQGEIRIGSTNIRDVNLAILRKYFNLVTQDNQLFHDTIEHNIGYGGTEISLSALKHASSLSGILDHIEGMPEQFSSVIGDQGTTLSGGQKQRIVLARSILRDAAVILLDEATSGIDSETEKEILENICQFNSNKTIIIVSHRLSAIKDVDEIICLANGSVSERGSHAELIEKRGYYWALFKDQI